MLYRRIKNDQLLCLSRRNISTNFINVPTISGILAIVNYTNHWTNLTKTNSSFHLLFFIMRNDLQTGCKFIYIYSKCRGERSGHRYFGKANRNAYWSVKGASLVRFFFFLSLCNISRLGWYLAWSNSGTLCNHSKCQSSVHVQSHKGFWQCWHCFRMY